MRGGCFLLFSLLVFVLVASMTAPPAKADSLPPEAEIVYPLPGTWERASYVNIAARFSDPDGIDLSSLSMKIDNMSLVISWTNFEAWGHAEGLAEGAHTAEVKVSDNLGNGPTVLTWSFLVDGTLPVVDITYPTGDPVLEDGSINLAWTGSDVPSGIDRYEVTLDDGPPVDVGDVTTCSFHALPPGVHNFEVTAYDLAGNANADPRRAVATVPTPPQGNTTNYYTGVAADPLPAWAIVLIMVNAVEAAAVAWVVLRQRRRTPGGEKPGP